MRAVEIRDPTVGATIELIPKNIACVCYRPRIHHTADSRASARAGAVVYGLGVCVRR